MQLHPHSDVHGVHDFRTVEHNGHDIFSDIAVYRLVADFWFRSPAAMLAARMMAAAF